MIYGWSPGIGDPSCLGWLTVLGYFLASILCVRAARHDAGATNLWWILAIALALLGINKQLDLQSLLTAVGRELARAGGWFDQRREMQRLFVLMIGLTVVALSIAAPRLLNDRSRYVRAACIGFVLLVAFVCIRAASLHHVDRFLKSAVLGARFNWLLELGGIAVIALAAVGASRATMSESSTATSRN
jgi:hypothetical protein